MTGLLEGAPGLPGVSRTDAAGFILEGVRNTLRGEGCTPPFPVLENPMQPAFSEMAQCTLCLAPAVQDV